MPELYACLYAKEFPAQAMLRLRPELREKPCAILEGTPPTQFVCSLNTKARIQGVLHGMTRVELDTFPSVVTLERSLAEESAAKTALLECAGNFSPSLECLSSGRIFLCVVDVAGMEMLFGSPQTLAKSLGDCVRALGIASSVSIASNFHASICIARGSGSSRVVIPPGTERTALAPLPVRVLDLSADSADTFALWGINTLGMLAALPQKSLIARMGQEGKRLQQLACGTLPHLFVPIEPAFALEEYMELDTQVELLDSLLFVVGVMLEQLVIRATAKVLALASVTIHLVLEGDTSHTRTVRPAIPANDRQLWIKLLHLDLEAHPPSAAILGVRLRAEPGSTSKVQLGLFSPQLPDPNRLDVTLARIRAIVGEDFVGSPLLKDTHQPDAFQMKPFAVPSGSATKVIPNQAVSALRQLRPPENVTVTLREKLPISIFFREKRFEVERAYGPWVTGGEWWSQTRWGFQQWDLVARSHDESLLCGCLIRNLTHNIWQMVALYD